MLDMWVPFPALSSAFHMFRDELQLFHSCKINIEILGLTVLAVSTGHRLIQELWSRERPRQCKCHINKRMPCCGSKSTSMCGLRVAGMIFLHVACVSMLLAWCHTTSAVSAHIPPLECFYLGIPIGNIFIPGRKYLAQLFPEDSKPGT